MRNTIPKALFVPGDFSLHYVVGVELLRPQGGAHGCECGGKNRARSNDLQVGVAGQAFHNFHGERCADGCFGIAGFGKRQYRYHGDGFCQGRAQAGECAGVN